MSVRPPNGKASSLRSQKSSAKHSGIFWPPTSLHCKFQQLRGYSNSLPVAYPILLFLAVLTRTTFFPSLAHHTNLFLSLSSSAIRSHLISLFTCGGAVRSMDCNSCCCCCRHDPQIMHDQAPYCSKYEEPVTENVKSWINSSSSSNLK